MNKLSIVVLAHNEAALLKDCLQSVSTLQAELIVIDCDSSDDSATIAKSFGAKVYKRPNNPLMMVNKNFAFSKAKGEWILNPDADERITPELLQEIQTILASPESKYNGYWIPRKNKIFNKWIEHTGWYPDYQLRFFKRGKGKYPEQFVHEALQLDGEAGYLTHPMLHLNYTSVSQFLGKLSGNYAKSEAELLIRKGKRVIPMDSVRMPFHEFISRYFYFEGYKDGLHGLVLSMLQAFYQFIVFCFIWEHQEFNQTHPKTVFHEFLSECKKMNKEFHYWVYSSFILLKGKSLKGHWYRLRRKIVTGQLKKK